MVGIVGYGVYVPRFRIKVEDIARVWNRDPNAIKSGLGISEKSLPGTDEDTATISVEAARNAVRHAGINPVDIGAVFVGSESHPYAVKPTATVVAEAVEATPVMTAADTEFACKAGTVAIQMCMGMVSSGMIKYGLAIGADTAQGRPGDALEYTAGAGGAAFIIGKGDVVAEIEDTFSFTTDTPDFWRRDLEHFPQHGSKFTGEPAYFRHLVSGAKGIMEKTKTTVNDFDHVVFHQPNEKFPLRAAKILGIPTDKLKHSLVVSRIGNTYSGASMVGLASVLDVAKTGQRILVVSYGSGAGSDAFVIKTTPKIEEKRNRVVPFEYYAKNKEYVDYAVYLKHRKTIMGMTPG
ncbi:MAG: hydroxymethylglutaryl-CoA synthase [Candidatus Aenigmarchaeota archaeon]|nr:hydroxymethylglutaryl-CoA synthase [Candidatus Aenigmarchaeota archaeon]